MKIHVKILRGSECTLEVQPEMSVAELKKLVEQSLNVPSNQQRLLITGKPLLDSKTLNDYGIHEDSKINLVVINRENTFPASQSTPSYREKDMLRQEMRQFLHFRFNPNEADKILEEFMKEFYRTTTACNLEDWERIATGYLHEGS